ncbi:hypothetical protein FAUST_4245 [Fusarium austroamericanum]|uniref:Putative gamma-glutamylcyclotransferase n=1 Tax=Fusarium austroamericanum TaxID=282268 RepID=A0AAN6C3D8_FUSAU|nr:hypothetical protein FAUST_4245 [Fusarium austroamericanum]
MTESSQPRPLFVYGTLRALPLLAWALTGDSAKTSAVADLVRPAKVHSYARYSIPHSDYPAVIKQDGHEVYGCVLLLRTKSQQRKLDDFEGDAYTPTAILATLDNGATMEADIYLWNGTAATLSMEPGWDLDTFVKERLEDWLDLFEGMELIGESDTE